MAMAMIADTTIPQKMSWTVFQKRVFMSVATLRLVTKLLPHLKRTKSLSQCVY